MLFCALKLVWDLLSRPSAQTVHPFICLSVYPSVSPLPRPSIHTFECPLLLPTMRLSICPSVHPVRRSGLPFWPIVRPSVCLCVFPTIHPFNLSFVRPSVRLTIYLSTMAPGSWLQKFIITTVKV